MTVSLRHTVPMATDTDRKEPAMSNPNVLDQLVSQYRIAKRDYDHSRVGSKKGAIAYNTIEKLVDKAEQLGLLGEFCRAANDPNN